MEQYPDIPIGFSDHSSGTNASYLAISKGAQVIELHFTDDVRIPGPDQLISKVPLDFKSIRDFFNFTCNANGLKHKKVNPAEYFTWKTQRKSLYASKNISQGEQITYTNTSLKSPPLGISLLF